MKSKLYPAGIFIIICLSLIACSQKTDTVKNMEEVKAENTEGEADGASLESNEEMNDEPDNQENEGENNEEADVEDLVTDWSTYENERFGFQVNYPSEWHIGQEPDNGDGVELYYVGADQIYVFARHFDGEYPSDLGLFEELETDSGQEAFLHTQLTDTGMVFYSVAMFTEDKEYRLNAEVSEEFFEEYEQVLREMARSFQVAESEGIQPVSAEHLDWDSYRNTRFGFELSYPDYWEAGEETENGDGLQLYSEGGNDVIVYASFFDQEHSPNFDEFTDFTTESGEQAFIREVWQNGTEVQFELFLIKDDVQYNLIADVTRDFYEKYKEVLRAMARSFAIVEGLENGNGNVNWTVYTNSRFGFEVNYPVSWPAGKAAGNGDGMSLYQNGGNKILAYASHYMPEFGPELSNYTEIELKSGLHAYIMKEVSSNFIAFDLAVIENGIEYHLKGSLSPVFYHANEEIIEEMIHSFQITPVEEL
ncbi:hypothetical protein MM300_06730 [Evansella sp. LMS18]|uniref:hypothetical protein n=1 Tax=Evansella sp. LMS18 TaxID=2924033 RepID=UPI0020D17AEA|nr:hypothetical protein [Evansella sp. LMS18]UTR11984.1 hypothetical protein MM300_06730 [Evansella sp. LMS18]